MTMNRTTYDIPNKMRVLVLDETGFEHLKICNVRISRPSPHQCWRVRTLPASLLP